MTLRKLFVFALVLFMLSMPALGQNLTGDCVADGEYDAEVDYFPDKVTIDYAQGFEVEYFNNYKLVTITKPWQFAEESFEYVLVQCGTPIPDGYDESQVIMIPVQNFVAMATTILPHLDNQGLIDTLVGVDTLMFTSTASVLELAENDGLIEIGSGGSFNELNVELLLDLEPDLVMTQQYFSGQGTIELIQETGIPVVLNADFADTSPLGQAEWGKYISLFFNTETAASEAFAGVEERYRALVELVEGVEERPGVFAASPYDGTWYMPAGESTVAQFFADAGADFLWAEEAGSSIPLDFESVYERAIDADFWVNINQFWATTDDALADDTRYAEFLAFQNGDLWNNNARMNENGGSDYFETGSANPDLILADLIAIFHPELLPDHEFVFYQKLED